MNTQKRDSMARQQKLGNSPYVKSTMVNGKMNANVKLLRSITKQSQAAGDSTASPEVVSRLLPQHSPSVHVVQHHQNIRHTQLEAVILQQQRELQTCENELTALRDQLAEQDRELLQLKSRATVEQRALIHENVEFIRLQRQLREKSTELAMSEAKYAKLDQVNDRLLAEQKLSQQLQIQLRSAELFQGANSSKQVAELDYLRRENEILKASTEKLLASAFDSERDQQREAVEKMLRAQVSQLELAVKAGARSRDELLEKLTSEMTEKESRDHECRRLQAQCIQLKADNDEVRRRLDKLTKDLGSDWTELEAALAEIRARREDPRLLSKTPSFVTSIQTQKETDAEQQLAELHVAFADADRELEKTRNMLLLQHDINNDYQKQIDILSRKAEEQQREYEARLLEQVKLIEERNSRIQLEAQVYNIIYGTEKQQMVAAATDEVLITADQICIFELLEQTVGKSKNVYMFLTDETMVVEQGKNIIEICLTKIALTNEALQYMQDRTPNVFLTLGFYVFEPQVSPVVKGPTGDLQFAAKYEVEVDDLLLHCLQSDAVTVELHQAFGAAYKPWAAAQLFLRELLDSPNAKLYGSISLIATSNGLSGTVFCIVDYSVCFRSRELLEDALAAYRARIMALGYIVKDRQEVFGRRELENKSNKLNIQIHRLQNLSSNFDQTLPPSAYVVYQFFNFPDHDTKIGKANSNSELDDKETYAVVMDAELHSYLQKESLRMVVFDDDAPTEGLSHLGYAQVPLLPLSLNKPIRGSFQIKSIDGSNKGTVDVSISWQFIYIAPKQSLATAKPVALNTTEDQNQLEQHERAQNQSRSMARVQFSGDQMGHEGRGDLTKEESRKADGSDQKSVVQLQEKPKPLIRSESFTIQRDDGNADVGAVLITQKLPVISSYPEIEQKKLFADNDESRKTGPVVQPTAPPRKNRIPVAEIQPSEKKTSQPPSFDNAYERSSSESETEDDDLVVISAKTPAAQNNQALCFQMVIVSVKLPEDSPLLQNESINKIFVEWTFPEVPSEQCETPESLPVKRTPGEVLSFNHSFRVPIDTKTNQEKAQHIMSFLEGEQPMQFVLVSDPEDMGDCQELGTANVMLKQLLNSVENELSLSLPFQDAAMKTVALLQLSFSDLGNLNKAI